MTWEGVTAKNETECDVIINIAKEIFANGDKVDLQVRKHEENRKRSQNNLQFHWFQEMEQQGDKSAKEYRAQCKLEIGVPIAREREEYRVKYDAMLRPLPYGVKLALMDEPFNMEVTRIFTIKEMTRYLQGIEQFAAKSGFRLTTNEDLYYQAMGLTR